MLKDGIVYPSPKHIEIPDWVGRRDDDWKFVVHSELWANPHERLRFRAACIARLVDGQSYVVWHSYPDSIPSNCHKFLANRYDGWRNLYPKNSESYGRTSYLASLPPSVIPCRRCVAARNWKIAAVELGLEPEESGFVESIEQFRSLPEFEVYNVYVHTLKTIYYSQFELNGRGRSTIKTLSRGRFTKGRVNHIIEEFLALGIVKLEKSYDANTTYVYYNELVDIHTSLSVLRWYGRFL